MLNTIVLIKSQPGAKPVQCLVLKSDVSPHSAVDIYCFSPAFSRLLSSPVLWRSLTSPGEITVISVLMTDLLSPGSVQGMSSISIWESERESVKFCQAGVHQYKLVQWRSSHQPRHNCRAFSLSDQHQASLHNLSTTFHIQQYSLSSDLELSETSFCCTLRRNKWCWTQQTTKPTRSSV